MTATDRSNLTERMDTGILLNRAARAILVVVLLCWFDASAFAQDPDPPADDHQHQHDAGAAQPTWSWSPDANVFFGYNYQQRQQDFTQFSAWESQNWFMLSGSRQAGVGRLMLHMMGSLE